jgi:hypothetical protein
MACSVISTSVPSAGGFKAVIGAAGSFAGLSGDQSVVVQDASDGRGHRQAGLM